MSRYQVAKNNFSSLIDDDEDFDDYAPPQTNSSTENQKSEFQIGAKRQPMTYSQIFEKACKDKKLSSINELANILDESLRIHQDERTLYCEKYETYDKFNPDEYEKLLDKRIDCFQTRYDDQDFINTVISRIPKEIQINEIKSLIDGAVDKLSKKKPIGHGSLFLIDLLFQQRPEIFNGSEEDRKKLFYVKHENIPRAGPPTLWLLSRALSKPSRVHITTNELISLFIDELLNVSEISVSGPYSVWASHLLNRHFNETNDNKISAHNYTELIPLLLRLKGVAHTNRDQHLKTVLNNLFMKLRIFDIKNYAHEIISHYPDFRQIPKEVKNEFLHKASNSPQFVNGWVSCYDDPDIHESCKIYLQEISNVYPDILNSFPESVISTITNEIAELKIKDKSLFNTSIRFTIAIVIVSVGFFLKKYEIL